MYNRAFFVAAALGLVAGQANVPSGSLLITLDGVYRCNLPGSIPLLPFLPSNVPKAGDNPAAALAFVASFAVNMTTMSSYSITSMLNPTTGTFYTDASCFVNYAMSAVTSTYEYLLPLDFSLDQLYIQPAIPRAPTMLSYFLSLASATRYSNLWVGTTSIASLPLTGGAVIATNYLLLSNGGDVGFTAITLSGASYVGSVALTAGGTITAAQAAAGPYSMYDIRVASSVPASALMNNDTRGGSSPIPEGVGAGTMRFYVDPSNVVQAMEFSPVNGTPRPIFASIAFGYPTTMPTTMQPPAVSALCTGDMFQNQSINLVSASPVTVPASNNGFVYIAGQDGQAMREFSFPVSPAGVNTPRYPLDAIACGDVIPGGGAEFVVFRFVPPSSGSLVAISAVTGKETTLITSFPFTVNATNTPRFVVSGDIDGDGFLDLVLASGGSLDNGIYWYKANGTLGMAGVSPFSNTPSGSAVTNYTNGVSLSAAPMIQRPYPPSNPAYRISNPYTPYPAASLDFYLTNNNASQIITVPAGAETSPQMLAWRWNTGDTLAQDPYQSIPLNASQFGNGAVVAALGARFTNGFIVVGSNSASSSALAYYPFFSSQQVPGFAPPSPAVPGPHALASGGVLFPAPAANNPCGPGSTAAAGYPGPTGVFFLSRANVAGVSFNFFTTSRTWTSFRSMMAWNSWQGALAAFAGGAVTTIFPALMADNVYVPPYSIATTYPLSALTFDFSTSWPRNDTAYWLNTNWNFATTTSGQLITPLNTMQGTWSPYDYTPQNTGYTPSFGSGGLSTSQVCNAGMSYGPLAVSFPPVALDPAGQRTLANWRRQRHIATAYSMTFMGYAYMHTHAPTFTQMNAQSGVFDYVSRARWMPGMDCSCFSGMHTNFAFGLEINTDVYYQGLVPVGYYFNGTAGGSNPSTPAVGGVPLNTFAYAATVATAPISYDNLISILKPGDILYIAGGGPAYGPSHVIMFLGTTTFNNGIGVGDPYPLILDSTDTQFAPDANGFLAPTGPHIRAFRPNEWYFQNFFSAHRWTQDSDDINTYWGGNAALIDPQTKIAMAPPTALQANTFPCANGVSPQRACVSTLPLTLDPRGHGCYPATSILNQGTCSGSYAFASATVASINLCMAAASGGIAAQSFQQISPQYIMALSASSTAGGPGCGNPNPCGGTGSASCGLAPLANIEAYAAANYNLTFPVATCSGNLSSPCSSGCEPFQYGNISPTATSVPKTSPIQCYSTTGQSVGSVTNDAQSMTTSSMLARFTLQATTLPVSGGALALSQPALAWLPSDVATVQSYILGTGSVSVQMSACNAWKMWMRGCSVTDLWVTTGNACTSRFPLPGYTLQPAQNVYVAPANTTQMGLPYSGPSCPIGTYTTSVTLVGWTVINGVPSWIAQASYGASWGVNGYFYAAIATAGLGNATRGGLGFSSPSTLVYTPRWNTSSWNPAVGIPGMPSTNVSSANASSIINGFNGNSTATATPSPNTGGSNGFVPVTNPTLAVSISQQFISVFNSDNAAQAVATYSSGGSSGGASGGSGRRLASSGSGSSSSSPLPSVYVVAQVVSVAAKPLSVGEAFDVTVQAYLFQPSLSASVQAAAVPTGLFQITGSLITYESGVNALNVTSLTTLPLPDVGCQSIQASYEQAKDAAIGLGVLWAMVVLVLAFGMWNHYKTKKAEAKAALQKPKALELPPAPQTTTAGNASVGTPSGSSEGQVYRSLMSP